MRHVSKFQIVLISAVLPLCTAAGEKAEQPRMWRQANQPARLTQDALVKKPVVQPAQNLSRTQQARFETKQVSASTVEVKRTSRPLSGLRRLFGKRTSESSQPEVMVPEVSETLQKEGRLP